MSTKNPKAAQRTQRRDFDKVTCLGFSQFGRKASSKSNIVFFVPPLCPLCLKNVALGKQPMGSPKSLR
jgi:hypothetical protein